MAVGKPVAGLPVQRKRKREDSANRPENYSGKFTCHTLHHRSVQLFSKVHKPRSFLVPKPHVSYQTLFISDLRVRRHFCGTSISCPFFGGRYQCSTKAMSPIFRDRQTSPQGNLHYRCRNLRQTAEYSLPEIPQAFHHPPRQRQRTEFQVVENVQHLGLVVLVACGIPQLSSQPEPFRKVLFDDRANDQLGARHWKTDSISAWREWAIPNLSRKRPVLETGLGLKIQPAAIIRPAFAACALP